MWRKQEAGHYTFKNFVAYQCPGVGWALLKDKEGIARFKTFKHLKAYVKKLEA